MTLIERILANRIAALKGIDGSAVASSVVDADAAAGASVLPIADTAGFVVGKPVMIDCGGSREEVTSPVESIQAGISLTFQAAGYWPGFGYAHSGVQADAVKQDWYNNIMGSVESWHLVPLCMTGPWPTVGVKLGTLSWQEGETLEREVVSQLVEIVAWQAVRKVDPTDQDNDKTYLALLHDLTKALFADWTCGELASGMRMIARRPLDGFDAGDETKELPLVGVQIQLEVILRQRIDDLYY